MRFDDPEVREFVGRSMVVRLAALSPKGQPMIECLTFICRRGNIYMTYQDNRPTGRAISVHPDVVLLFDGELGPRASHLLRARGHAVFGWEGRILARVVLGLARKHLLTRPGLRHVRANWRKIPRAIRFYAERGWEARGQGVARFLEVVPESFEWLPRSPAQAAS